MQTNREIILILIISSILLISVLITFVMTILFFYKKKQNIYFNSINSLKNNHEKNLLTMQLEIQEHTQLNISREIHDNIGLALTLAKLNLNTLEFRNIEEVKYKINNSIDLIGNALQDLRNISRSLNSDVIKNHGLLKAIDEEVTRVQKSCLIKVSREIMGETRYLDTQIELLLFRIIQEALNNVIKHSQATIAKIELIYHSNKLLLNIIDNGKGFDTNSPELLKGSGLSNIIARSKIISGEFSIYSCELGTKLQILIPY